MAICRYRDGHEFLLRLTLKCSHPRITAYRLFHVPFQTKYLFISICSEFDLDTVSNTPPDDKEDEPAMFKRAPWRRRRWRFRVRVRGRRLLKKVCKYVKFQDEGKITIHNWCCKGNKHFFNYGY